MKKKSGDRRTEQRHSEKRGEAIKKKPAGQTSLAASPPNRVRVSPHHPLRALLRRASGAWEQALTQKLLVTDRGLQGTVPGLDKLARLIDQKDAKNLTKLRKKIWSHLPPPPPPEIDLEIMGILPPSPLWLPALGERVQVTFVLRNNSSQSTSGFVHGSATQALIELVSSSWFQTQAIANNLMPGQAFNGMLELDVRTLDPGAAHGPKAPPIPLAPLSPNTNIDVNLEYWVEDPSGTITFVRRLDGNQQATTYNAVAFSQESIEPPPIGFATYIRPLFREMDIMAMRQVDDPIDLASYQDVKKRATDIYNSVAHPTGVIAMPCDGLWPQDYIDTFKQWMDAGMPP